MSLPLITDTAAEVHRLAIAGSALAAGDFRLNKLVPQLESLGAKAPIFSRIAQGVKVVTEESDAAKAGRALLDLSTLLTAIQYTQSPHGAEGEFTPINTGVQSWTPTVAGYRSLAAVVEALTSTGEGRLEIVKDACERGLFKDLRLMQPAIGALSDRFGELADHVAEHAIPQFGLVVIPLLKAGFDPKGGNAHARRLRALCALDKEEGRAFARAALEEARKEVKVAAISGLHGSGEDLNLILPLLNERSEEVRHAAIRALGGIPEPQAKSALHALLKGKDAAAAFAAVSGGGDMPPEVFDAAIELIPAVAGSGPAALKAAKEICALIQARVGWRGQRSEEFLDHCLSSKAAMQVEAVGVAVAKAVFELNNPSWDAKLIGLRKVLSGEATLWSFLAGHRRLAPEELLKDFRDVFAKDDESILHNLLAGEADDIAPQVTRESLHRGWLTLAMKVQSSDAVAWLAQPGDAEAAMFLIKLEEELTKRHPHFSYMYCEDIVRIAPATALEYLVSRVERLQVSKRPIYLAPQVFTQIETLEAALLPELEKRGAKLKDPWKKRFDEALSVIRHRAADA